MNGYIFCGNATNPFKKTECGENLIQKNCKVAQAIEPDDCMNETLNPSYDIPGYVKIDKSDPAGVGLADRKCSLIIDIWFNGTVNVNKT